MSALDVLARLEAALTPIAPASPATSSVVRDAAVAVVFRIAAGDSLELLMIERASYEGDPWSGHIACPGGRMEPGDRDLEVTAVRETREETGHVVTAADLHLFSMIAEKAYEGETHWLMFLFRCTRPIGALPPAMKEGRFGFFTRAAVDALPIPETDRVALWPTYDHYRDRFVALKADCQPGRPVRVEVEEIIPATAAQHLLNNA